MQWSQFSMSQEDTDKETRAWTIKAITHVNEEYMAVHEVVRVPA